MKNPFLIALLLGGFLFASCSGGSDGPTSASARCAGGGQFCIQNCNLGCANGGCGVTDIAQNQPIVIQFNAPIDPSSVNAASVSIQTRNGEAPVGRLLVNGNELRFEPDIKIVGGVTSFGFRANETYILTLPGGPAEPQSLRSTSGDRLPQTLSCTLNVTRGVEDLDGQPPVGTMISPASTTGVPTSVTIILAFSEILDVQPFQGATTATAPVLYRLRRTRPKAGGGVECDPAQPAVDLGGVPQAIVDPINKTTQVVLKPTVQLPGGVCVEVEVTDRVTDLSGKPAARRVFSFITDAGQPQEFEVSESFGTGGQLDPAYSSGSWGNGSAKPGVIGGHGLMGEFDIRDGRAVTVPLGADPIYEWNTDNQTIPGARTLDGNDVTVTDGVFFFSRFEVPENTVLRWVGSTPPQVFVRGEINVRGKIELNAPSPGVYQGGLLGQPGAAGAPGGAKGGDGARASTGLTNPSNGLPGEDVLLPAGHAYSARAVGTGGGGSLQYPVAPLQVTYSLQAGQFSAQIAAGGAGGGFAAQGAKGEVISTNGSKQNAGPDSTGGIAFDLFPVPSGTRSVDHFMVGGSGGGGSGSHPHFSLLNTPVVWKPGTGGGGGGGAILFRAGGNIRTEAGSEIQAFGGRGGLSPSGSPPLSPGGGGSGGSILMQCGGASSVLGAIDTSGGKGGTYQDGAIYIVHVVGGDGAAGSVRLETPNGGGPSLLPNTVPAATANSVGVLSDSDLQVGDQSRFYPTRQLFKPTFLRYEVRAKLDGQDVFYSDDPSWTGPSGFRAMGPAIGMGSAVQVYFQGAQVQATTGQVDPATIGDWRRYVGRFAPAGEGVLDDDDATGYRFLVLYDLAVSASIEITRVTVYFEA